MIKTLLKKIVPIWKSKSTLTDTGKDQGIPRYIQKFSNRWVMLTSKIVLFPETAIWLNSCDKMCSMYNKKDGYRLQNVRQRQKLISFIDYDVCMTFY